MEPVGTSAAVEDRHNGAQGEVFQGAITLCTLAMSLWAHERSDLADNLYLHL